MPDVAIPLVFPDYLIAVATPPVRVDVPDWLPGVPNEVTIPSSRAKLPYLGHAGVMFFNGRTGMTKYYEYGRYDPAEKGLVRRQPIPDVRIDRSGRPTGVSLKSALSRVSTASGQRGRIEAAYIELAFGAFDLMLGYALRRAGENANPRRTPYDLTSHSCLHFAKAVAEAGGATLPRVIDPRPAGYMDSIRDDLPDLDFSQPARLSIEGITLP